jgi:predicted MFS family arabinose efflux permease
LIGAFTILCVAMMLAGLAYRGVALVLPATFEAQTTFLRDLLQRFQLGRLEGISNLAATLIASGVYAVGMIGQVVGGHIADRHDLRKTYLIFHATSLPFVLAMGFCSEWALVLVAGAYVFFALGMQPIENSLVASLTPDRWRSTGYGVKFVLNFGVGSLAVYGVTALHQDDGFLPVYASVAALVFLVCVAAIILFRRTHGTLTQADSGLEPLLS